MARAPCNSQLAYRELTHTHLTTVDLYCMTHTCSCNMHTARTENVSILHTLTWGHERARNSHAIETHASTGGHLKVHERARMLIEKLS